MQSNDHSIQVIHLLISHTDPLVYIEGDASILHSLIPNPIDHT